MQPGRGLRSRLETVGDRSGGDKSGTYTYRDVPHDFGAFADADEDAGWPAIAFLQRSLGHRS